MLSDDLDWTSLEIVSVAWGDVLVEVGEEWSFREIIPDYRPDEPKTWWVDFDATLDTGSGKLSFVFRTLDPETGDLPLDALAGFLPPNDDTHRGEGSITFRVKPLEEIANGTVISNAATIVFDTEAPIITNEVFSTISTNNLAVVVPNVANETFEAAESALSALGLGVTRQDTYSLQVPLGRVVSQSTSGGSSLICGGSVELVVSLGPDPGGGNASITVAAPNGGEKWRNGSSRKIKWTYSSSSGADVKIDLLRKGKVVMTLSENTPNDGQYKWKIPTTGIKAKKGYKIQITDKSNAQITDKSDGSFKIKAAK